MQGASRFFREGKTAWITLVLLLAMAMAWPVVAQVKPADKGAGLSDPELRKRVVGVWQDDYQGRRTMTVRADGTGTMLVELKGWRAALYASRLQFEMLWSIEGGRMEKHSTGGSPAGKVKAILKMMGDRVNEPILELTAERLVLLDEDGKRRYTWRRVKPDSQS